MIGAARRKGSALWAGLAFLALVNLLDLIGVLALDLSAGSVGLGSALWTGVIAGLIGPDLQELAQEFKTTLAVLAVHALGVVGLGAMYADTGTHYAIHATAPGQFLWAIAPVLLFATATLGVLVTLAWVQEYREIRSQSPEDRVLD